MDLKSSRVHSVFARKQKCSGCVQVLKTLSCYTFIHLTGVGGMGEASVINIPIKSTFSVFPLWIFFKPLLDISIV